MTDPRDELELICRRALLVMASRIHFRPAGMMVEVRLRMGRVLVADPRLPTVSTAVVAQLMRGADLDHGPGAVRMVEAGGARWRLTATATAGGPHVCLHRVLAGAAALDRIGLLPGQVARVTRELGAPGGVTMFCGPPGSGKTTTFYSAVAVLGAASLNVVTLEDPIEQRIEGVLQRAWPERRPTVHEVLRSLMHQDPDVVGIGVVDDPTTAVLALDSARSGPKVVATASISRASLMASRLMNYGCEPFMVVSALRQVVCQRLVRVTCPHCAEDDPVGARRFAELGVDVSQATMPKLGRGCDRCDRTGYQGNTALFEVLELTPALRELVMQGAGAEELECEAVKAGMATLHQAAAMLIASGQLSVDEALRHLGPA